MYDFGLERGDVVEQVRAWVSEWIDENNDLITKTLTARQLLVLVDMKDGINVANDFSWIFPDEPTKQLFGLLSYGGPTTRRLGLGDWLEKKCQDEADKSLLLALK
jgi:hypothetical protein